MKPSLVHRLVSEFLGTALLTAVVFGSGAMGEKLSGGNAALALFVNSVATGAGLAGLILAFGSLSAHFNPAVTIAEVWNGALPRSELAGYFAAQVLGAIAGAVLTHVMFSHAVLTVSATERSGVALFVSEFIATFGLLAVVLGGSRTRPESVPFAVGGYITAVYWFTASTGFANPAMTVARMLTDTPAGVRPIDGAAFIVAQLLGGLAATALFRVLLRRDTLQRS